MDAAAVMVLLSRLAALLAGQSLSPRDGQQVLSAPAPRTPDGKPDLTGVWEPDGPKYLRNLAADLKPGEVPFQPASEALFKERERRQAKNEFEAKCLPPGVPKINAELRLYKIIQTPAVIFILYEAFDVFRQIFTDGRALPKDPEPTWMGYSVGKWEGNALVVDSNGFTEKTWLDDAGHPHTDALHVTERFSRRDSGHIDLDITIEDPKAYTKPWRVREYAHLVLDKEVREFVCNDSQNSK